MATYELNLPVDDAQIEKLKVGDIIYLNGQVCTARDMAHLEMRALVEAGKPLPEDIRGGAIFHAGPVMKKDKEGKWYLSVIGPTTSIRMEPHADFVGAQGVKVIIGKGGMGEGTKAALLSWLPALSARRNLTGSSTACPKRCGRFRPSTSVPSSSRWIRMVRAATTK